ncbi:MAG: hypothetical protein J1F65_02285 [Clostridiales bacterium]|nr:hypothetical protein [Clostridiales bacterium]
MEYDGVNSIVCDAEENDWLDVSYSERKYVQEEQPKSNKRKFNFKFKFPKINLKLRKPLQIALIAVLCVALLAAMLFIDGNFASDVFQTAKAAFSGSVFDANDTQNVSASISIPANANLLDVADGVATFDGGRVTVSFTDGKVVNVTETTVTVAVDDDTTITYGNLTEVFVAIGDTVSVNTLLGRYDGTFTATVAVSGQIKDVVGSESQLAWMI